MTSEAELMRVKLTVDGVRQVKREVRAGTHEMVSDVRRLQEENLKTARSHQVSTRAVRDATTAGRSYAVSAENARRQMYGVARANDEATAAIRRNVAAAKSAQFAHAHVADSARRAAAATSSVGDRAERDRLALMAKGVTGVAAAYGALRYAAMGGLETIRRYEAREGFQRATRSSMGISSGTALAVRTDEFSDRMGLRRDATRASVMQLAGTGEVGKADDVIKTIEAFMALAQKGGATAEARERAFAQYVQIASSGRLQGDELRSIQEAGLPLRKLLNDAGLGSRIGTENAPTFAEINKVLLEFGKTKDSQAMLAEGAETATASLNRLSNATEDLIVPIGKVLTPSVKSAAGWLTNLEKSLDPGTVEAFSQGLVNVGPALIGVAGVVGVGALVLKGKLVLTAFQADKAALTLFKVAAAGDAAALALNTAAARAAAGGVAGVPRSASAGVSAAAVAASGQPGRAASSYVQPPAVTAMWQNAAARRIAGNPSANRTYPGLPIWASKLGRGAAGVARGAGSALGIAGAGFAGSMIGDAVAGQLSGGNEWARTGGAIAGGALAPGLVHASAKGVASIVAAKYGAGAAAGASGAGLAFGGAFGLAAGLGVLGIEALTGVAGTDKSIVVRAERARMGLGSAEDDIRKDQEMERYQRTVQEIRQLQRSYQKNFKLTRVPTVAEMQQWAPNNPYLQRLVKERDQFLDSHRSRRGASPENKQAEIEAKTQRQARAH
ncbi:MAG: tape measure protein [Fimbriimonas sp.]